MAGQDHKVIFQGVHQLMSHHVGAPWLPDERRQSRLVFIGLELPQAQMMQTLQKCLV
jgi:G3E family GTPase